MAADRVPVQALLGFVLLTGAVTWVLQVYPALTRRRALGLTGENEPGMVIPAAGARSPNSPRPPGGGARRGRSPAAGTGPCCRRGRRVRRAPARAPGGGPARAASPGRRRPAPPRR